MPENKLASLSLPDLLSCAHPPPKEYNRTWKGKKQKTWSGKVSRYWTVFYLMGNEIVFYTETKIGSFVQKQNTFKNVQFCPTFRFQAFLRIFCFMLETKSPFQYHHHFQICLCFRFNRKMREMFLLLVLFLCFFQ